MVFWQMKKVFVKFPKVGLGNMMLIWARAVVFSNIHGCHYITSSWWGIRWGTFLRKEKRKRMYFNYFIESSFWSKIFFRVHLVFRDKIYNPPLIDDYNLSNQSFCIFNQIVVDNDLFNGLRDHRQVVIDEFNRILHPRIKKELMQIVHPEISVHGRRGDFKLGNPITALSFFINGINLIRKIKGKEISVMIFSDADKSELSDLLNLNNIAVAPFQTDIVDLLQMSKSKVIFLSQSSSFSYWSAFLSEALVVIPEADWQDKIAYDDSVTGRREIKWNADNEISNKILSDAIVDVQF